ncbi:MAG: hypothetical protein ABRQ39_15790 [Candidatus Eremiobacterota bacterium]
MEKIVDYHQTLIDELRELPEESLPNLLQIIRLFKESVLLQTRKYSLSLYDEFSQWDQLSDEAFIEFEKGL